MTKREWTDLRTGQRVYKKLNAINPVTRIMELVVYSGTTVHFNSNASQVLVKWDNTEHEIWYGRLGLDLKI